MEDQRSESCSTCGPWWRLPLLLGLVLAAVLWSRPRNLLEVPQSNKDHAVPASDASPRDKVSLDIDFGGGQRKNFDAVAWHEGMTVADLLQEAPGIAISQKGSGEAAIFTSIDGVENEGATGRNWTYTVNGQSADRSAAVYALQPGDRVLWTFGPRQ